MMPAAAFGSRDRKKATAGLKRASRSGVAGARKKKQNAKKRAAQTGAETYQRLLLAKEAGKKLTKTQEKALQRHEGEFLASHGHSSASARQAAKDHNKRARIVGRILGPSGEAGAVKISKADGKPFTASDLAAWRKEGWGIEAAGTVAGRPGAGGLAGTVIRPDDFAFENPEPLGAGGLARAVVILGKISEQTLFDLVADGYDVAPAPKRLREAMKNPAPVSTEKKVYAALVSEAKKGHALNEQELMDKLNLHIGPLMDALAQLAAKGLAHQAGRDQFGLCWAPGTPSRGLFDNPRPGAKAEKKAAAWYQMKRLESGAKTINLPDTVEAVEIGKIVSITYESDKYDGRKRLWKHDVTGDRTLHISTDGKVLVVLPGFKVTKRGIEG
jgi:hypothetical protein